MRCYNVLVHGKFDWLPGYSEGEELDAGKPAGFYCHRYVLAADESEAVERPFRRVRSSLDRQTRWMRDGLVTVDLEAEQVAAAPIHKLLKPDNRGHTFYKRE